MKKKKLLLLGLACMAAVVFAVGVRGNAAEEVKRLAALMEWKPGTVAADIGAGDGKYTFAAGGKGGASGEEDGAGSCRKKLGGVRNKGGERKQGKGRGGGRNRGANRNADSGW